MRIFLASLALLLSVCRPVSAQIADMDNSVREFAQTLRGDRKVVPFDDYLQFFPVAMDLSLGLMGCEAENRFAERAVEASIAYAVSTSVVWIIKPLSRRERPNGRNSLSFPSGHTAVAFTGAELVRLEYGWGWGTAAYAAAATVGCMRIYRNYHWLSDVLAGAGIGILSADLGRRLLDPACDILGINKTRADLSVSPSVDPVSGAVVTALTFRF